MFIATGVTLGFFEEDYAVTEGNSVTIDVTKDDPNQSPIEVQIVPLTLQEYADQGGTIPPEIIGIINTVAPARCEIIRLIWTLRLKELVL